MFRQRNPLLLISAAQERLRKWIGPISASPAAVPSIFRIPTAALSFSSKRSENSSSRRPKSLKYLSLALMAGTAATTLALLNDERRKKTFAQIHYFHQSLLAKPATHSILEIPGLAQNEGAIHGVSTRELGNFGFITLNDGVKAKDLIADISQGIDEVARFTKQKSDIRAQGKKPLLILNETAYATTTAPGLLKDSENQAQLILSLTEANIEKFIAENRFPETGEFAALRDKCIRVTADGFVSNLSQFAEYQLYFAVNTADAAPVILVDKLKGIIGIMTCSWHNIAKAELDELIKKMIQLGAKPSQMSMGIGPGLGPNSFEFNTSDTRNFYEPGIIDKRDG